MGNEKLYDSLRTILAEDNPPASIGIRTSGIGDRFRDLIDRVRDRINPTWMVEEGDYIISPTDVWYVDAVNNDYITTTDAVSKRVTNRSRDFYGQMIADGDVSVWSADSDDDIDEILNDVPAHIRPEVRQFMAEKLQQAQIGSTLGAQPGPSAQGPNVQGPNVQPGPSNQATSAPQPMQITPNAPIEDQPDIDQANQFFSGRDWYNIPMSGFPGFRNTILHVRKPNLGPKPDMTQPITLDAWLECDKLNLMGAIKGNTPRFSDANGMTWMIIPGTDWMTNSKKTYIPYRTETMIDKLPEELKPEDIELDMASRWLAVVEGVKTLMDHHMPKRAIIEFEVENKNDGALVAKIYNALDAGATIDDIKQQCDMTHIERLKRDLDRLIHQHSTDIRGFEDYLAELLGEIVKNKNQVDSSNIAGISSSLADQNEGYGGLKPNTVACLFNLMKRDNKSAKGLNTQAGLLNYILRPDTTNHLSFRPSSMEQLNEWVEKYYDEVFGGAGQPLDESSDNNFGGQMPKFKDNEGQSGQVAPPANQPPRADASTLKPGDFVGWSKSLYYVKSIDGNIFHCHNVVRNKAEDLTRDEMTDFVRNVSDATNQMSANQRHKDEMETQTLAGDFKEIMVPTMETVKQEDTALPGQQVPPAKRAPARPKSVSDRITKINDNVDRVADAYANSSEPEVISKQTKIDLRFVVATIYFLGTMGGDREAVKKYIASKPVKEIVAEFNQIFEGLMGRPYKTRPKKSNPQSNPNTQAPTQNREAEPGERISIPGYSDNANLEGKEQRVQQDMAAGTNVHDWSGVIDYTYRTIDAGISVDTAITKLPNSLHVPESVVRALYALHGWQNANADFANPETVKENFRTPQELMAWYARFLGQQHQA